MNENDGGFLEIYSNKNLTSGNEDNKEVNLGLDPYGYNLIGFNVSGPLIKIWDKTDSTKIKHGNELVINHN